MRGERMAVLHRHGSLSSSLKGGDAERAHALPYMVVTAAVSHALMSWLNDGAYSKAVVFGRRRKNGLDVKWTQI